MLLTVFRDLRAWRRRERTRREFARLSPHLRDDIGLPRSGTGPVPDRTLFNLRFDRS